MARGEFSPIESGWWSGTWPTPHGYERKSWLDAKQGEEVYVLNLERPAEESGTITGTVAAGPYTIVDVAQRRLRKIEDASEVQECGERLLVKSREEGA